MLINLKKRFAWVSLFLSLNACGRHTSAPSAISEPETPVLEKVSLDDALLKESNFKRKASLENVKAASRYLSRSSFSKANEVLGRAVSLDPSNPWAQYYLGLSFFKQGQWLQSVRYFERAAELFENEEMMAWNADSLSKVEEGRLKLGSH